MDVIANRADIWVAIGLLAAASVLVFELTRRLSQDVSRIRMNLLAGALVAAIVWEMLLLRDSVSWAALAPLSGAAALANPGPLLMGMLAAVLWNSNGTPRWRRVFLVCACAVVGLRQPHALAMSKPPLCVDAWSEDVCLQTSVVTCSPAAASTLLNHYYIRRSETELAELCLTDERGTTRLGLYRGLKLAARDTGLAVRTGKGRLTDLGDSIPLPAVVELVLTPELAAREPRYASNWGWTVDVPHSAVVFGFTDDGLVEMGDPSFGREHWTRDGLAELWSGVYFTLERESL